MAMCILKYNGISEFPTYRTPGLHYRKTVPSMGWCEGSGRTAQNRHPVASIQYPASTVVSSWGPQQVGHIQPQLASVARRALKGTVDQLRNAVLCGIGGVLEDTQTNTQSVATFRCLAPSCPRETNCLSCVKWCMATLFGHPLWLQLQWKFVVAI